VIYRRIAVLERRLLLLRIGPHAAGRCDTSKIGVASAVRDGTTSGSGSPRAFYRI
jgi:hypothetical protein